MSSPVAHLACGYALYRVLSARDPELAGLPRGSRLVTASFFSLAPDLDFIAGWLAHDVHAFHNNLSHSFLFGLVSCLFLATAGHLAWPRLRLLPLWGFTFACYASHILIDFVTYGRGIMLFWPFLPDRFSSPLLLFRGVAWDEGLRTTAHVWTLAQDALFAVLVVSAGIFLARRIRPRADRPTVPFST